MREARAKIQGQRCSKATKGQRWRPACLEEQIKLQHPGRGLQDFQHVLSFFFLTGFCKSSPVNSLMSLMGCPWVWPRRTILQNVSKH